MIKEFRELQEQLNKLERRMTAERPIYVASMRISTGDPNGVVTAPQSTFYYDETNDDLYINTNGINAWQLVGGGSSVVPHNVLSATHPDTTPAAAGRGDLITGQGVAPVQWNRLAIGGNEWVLGSDGADAAWEQTTADGAAAHSTVLRSSAAGALTIDDYFTVDGGTFGIVGNELLTVHAAGTWAFSGISGVTVEDGDWIGNGAASSRLVFDSSGATDYAYFTGCYLGIGETTPQFDQQITHNRANGGLSLKNSTNASNYEMRFNIRQTEGIILQRTINDVFDASLVTFDYDGDVGIGDITPDAQLDVVQDSTTGAQPVLMLEQTDISEEAVYFIGESSAATADQTLVDASDFTTPGSIIAWVKVVLDDQRVGGLGTVDGWIPVYDIPTA